MPSMKLLSLDLSIHIPIFPDTRDQRLFQSQSCAICVMSGTPVYFTVAAGCDRMEFECTCHWSM